jgi:hypothetical protein
MLVVRKKKQKGPTGIRTLDPLHMVITQSKYLTSRPLDHIYRTGFYSSYVQRSNFTAVLEKTKLKVKSFPTVKSQWSQCPPNWPWPWLIATICAICAKDPPYLCLKYLVCSDNDMLSMPSWHFCTCVEHKFNIYTSCSMQCNPLAFWQSVKATCTQSEAQKATNRMW